MQQLNNDPPAALLEEYRLSLYKYHILQLCQTPHYWKRDGLTHSITCLYGMVAAGLLTGPEKGSPHSRPFEITGQGRDILGRIDIGLHQPNWLTVHRLNALRTMASNHGGQLVYSPKIHSRKFTRITLASLASHGYVDKVSNVQWRITGLGRTALAEYELNQEESL